MFDDSEQELGPVLALVLAIAILTSLFAIAVALSVTGLLSGAPDGPASTDGASTRSGDPVAIAPARVYFALDSAELPADAGGALFTMAVAATVDSTRRLEVSGYHDASGDKAHNEDLAKARALAVRDALQAAGVPAERIELQKPVAVLGGTEPREARRVEITLR